MPKNIVWTAATLVAASTAVTVPGGASAGSAAEVAEGSSGPLSPEAAAQLESEIRQAGLEVDPSALSAFLKEDRRTQTDILRAVGLPDPGGPLTDRAVQMYLRGYWEQRTRSVAGGAKLILASGLATPEESVAVASELSLDDFAPSGDEVSDTQAALGISRDEAFLRAQLQNLATHIRATLQEMVPGMLGLQIADSNDHLELLGKNFMAAADAIGRLGFEDHVRVVEASISEAELLDILEALTARAEGLPAHAEWTAYVDKRGERVIFAGDLENPDTRRLQSDDALSGAIARGQLVFSQAAEQTLPRPEVAMQGGRSTGGCTWAFSAHTDWDPDKLITASHCDGTQYYGFLALAFNKACQGTTYAGCDNPESDAQMHDVPQPEHTADNVIYANGTTREITSVTTYTSMDSGDSVCHEGKTTGYSCGVIGSKAVSQSLAPGSNLFIRVSGSFYTSSGGDSGGPYFFGGSAYGIHSTGGGGPPPDEFGNFGAITFAEPNLDMKVKVK